MFHEPYGPRGAEDERGDYWTNIAEGADMLTEDFHALPPTGPEDRHATGIGTDGTPDRMRDHSADRMKELASLAGFAVQDPYSPAVADNLDTGLLADDTAAESAVDGFVDFDAADSGDAGYAEDETDDSDVQLYQPGTRTLDDPNGSENAMPGSEVETEFPGEF